ncbi:hypothetical protein AA0117_g3955 [Alternaria alternata]|uniref:Uncharacterized protein n=1 Tax=Alternaria alternata TaxID=5599 RepID=A0A4Q4NKK6_ALTAL|nr:hypothetical protein AA0117_g3955 [Alternaria alternata]
MAITFGSFGDIIAAVQVVYKLIEVINAQRGAKREFGDLLVDLRLFHRYLEQLVSFWQTRQEDPSLEVLYNVLQPSISDTKGEISSFLEHIISRYGKSLLSKSKPNPKDVGKMLQWHMLERDNVARLQDKLRKSKEIILMVQTQANMILEEKDQSIVIERMGALADAETETARQLNERLDDLGGIVEKQGEALGLISRSIGSISSTIAPIANLVVDLPGMLAKIHAEQLSQRLLFFSLNPFAQNSAIVEDALGWKFSIPLELISSWNMQEVNSSRKQPSFHMVSALMEIPSFYGLVRTKVLSSSDPRCEMEIQRIEEIHDDTANNKMDSDATRPNFRTDGSIMQHDFEDEFPADLISTSNTEEGPEIFKRVRFLSRWEFRIESRGSLLTKTGQYNWWVANCLEATAMKQALVDALCENWDDSIYAVEGVNIFLNLFFVGSTLQQSRPVFLLFSTSKVERRVAWKVSIGIDWIKANPSLVVLTSCSTIFRSAIEQYYGMEQGTLCLKDS